MKTLRAFTAAALVMGMLAPTGLADGRNPGSVLIFTVQRSGPDFFTIVSVTNSNTTPATPFSFGGSVSAHYEYANVVPNQNPFDPEAPFRPLNCSIFNRFEFLTPADHLSVVTSCHNAVSPGGQEGYLVVSAEDPASFGTAWSHNYLMGSELVINASSGMYSINAVPFDAIAADGRPTDIGTTNGQLDFDGVEYEGVPDILYVDSFIALAGSQLALLNLTGGPRDVNTVQFTVWNDNEFALSQSRPFNCWFDQPLHVVAPLFEETFLANSTPDDPNELSLNCDGTGLVETGWARIESLGVQTQGGFPVDTDGALLGSITTGPTSVIDGGRLLWESYAKQSNGVAFSP